MVLRFVKINKFNLSISREVQISANRICQIERIIWFQGSELSIWPKTKTLTRLRPPRSRHFFISKKKENLNVKNNQNIVNTYDVGIKKSIVFFNYRPQWQKGKGL